MTNNQPAFAQDGQLLPKLQGVLLNTEGRQERRAVANQGFPGDWGTSVRRASITRYSSAA